MADEKELTIIGKEIPFILTPEFHSRIEQFKKEWYKKYRDIGKEKTPRYDGTGKEIVKQKGTTGYDYIEETYIRDRLDKHFPGWSWEIAAPLHFLGAEWVVAQGHLIVIDESLLAFNIIPPVRKFYGVDSVRIQYAKGMPHTQENIIDVGDNCKQAVTSALKYAANRLTRIGDDVYGKRLEMEGAGSIEDVLSGKSNDNKENAVIETNDNVQYKAFGEFLAKEKIRWSEVYEILGTRHITDYRDAFAKVRQAKELQ